MLTAIAQSLAAQAFGLLWGRWGYATVLPYVAIAALLAAAGAAVSLRTTTAGRGATT